MDLPTKTEMGPGEKYDDLVCYKISDIVLGIPEVMDVVDAGAIADMVQAKSIPDWEKIIMTAMKDLEPTHKFLFLCVAEWSIRFGGREHFLTVPRERYKSTALLYSVL